MSEPYIHPAATLIGDVSLGKYSSVWPGVVLRADLNSIKLGDYTNIQDNSVVHVDSKRGVSIGDYSLVAHNVVLHSCRIGKACLIAIGSIVLEGAEIGDGSLISAGTIVRSNQQIPPNSLVITREDKLVIYPKVQCTSIIAGALEYAVLAERTRAQKFGPFSDAELDDFSNRAEIIAEQLGLI